MTSLDARDSRESSVSHDAFYLLVLKSHAVAFPTFYWLEVDGCVRPIFKERGTELRLLKMYL